MSVHFYFDDAGYVGERERLSDHAQDVLDSANSVSLHLSAAVALMEDLADVAADKGTAVHDDPDGYGRHHVAHWTLVERQMGLLNDALTALNLMVRSA